MNSITVLEPGPSCCEGRMLTHTFSSFSSLASLFIITHSLFFLNRKSRQNIWMDHMLLCVHKLYFQVLVHTQIIITAHNIFVHLFHILLRPLTVTWPLNWICNQILMSTLPLSHGCKIYLCPFTVTDSRWRTVQCNTSPNICVFASGQHLHDIALILKKKKKKS